MDIIELLRLYLEASDEVKNRLDAIVGCQEQSADAQE